MPQVDDASPGGLVRRPVPQHLDTDALSAYLDDRLEPDARSVAASHLATCQDCRRELAELRTAVALLHGLPQYRPRRSFQLGPTYAGAVHGSRLARYLPLLPRLRTAAAVCALLLAVVTAADVLVDAEDGPAPSTEDVVVDEVDPAPADARVPTGREPLPEQDAGPEVESQVPASESGDAAPPVSDGAGDAVGAGGGAVAPAADGRSAAGPVSDEGAAGDGVADEAEGQTAGGATTTSAGMNTVQPASPASEPRRDLGGGDDGPSVWQVAQLGLGVTLAALVVALVVLQRLANRARRLNPGF